jgi:hypothetical protein
MCDACNLPTKKRKSKHARTYSNLNRRFVSPKATEKAYHIRPNGCWIVNAYTIHGNKVKFKRGDKSHTLSLSRYLWYQKNGRMLSRDEFLIGVCPNPMQCVNPDHAEIQMRAKGTAITLWRASGATETRCVKGHENQFYRTRRIVNGKPTEYRKCRVCERIAKRLRYHRIMVHKRKLPRHIERQAELGDITVLAGVRCPSGHRRFKYRTYTNTAGDVKVKRVCMDCIVLRKRAERARAKGLPPEDYFKVSRTYLRRLVSLPKKLTLNPSTAFAILHSPGVEIIGHLYDDVITRVGATFERHRQLLELAATELDLLRRVLPPGAPLEEFLRLLDSKQLRTETWASEWYDRVHFGT